MRHDRALEGAVRGVLLEHWDPIGVRFIGAAADEYDTQVLLIMKMLLQKASAADLRKFLDDAAYDLSPTWDDEDALDLTTRELLKLVP